MTTKEFIINETDALNAWREEQMRVYSAMMAGLTEQKERFAEDMDTIETIQTAMAIAGAQVTEG